jgi:hypothetical protein
MTLPPDAEIPTGLPALCDALFIGCHCTLLENDIRVSLESAWSPALFIIDHSPVSH